MFLKKERPSNLADVKQLAGTTVWMSAGGQMDYFPYAGHHADYSKEAGTLLGAEPLAIKDAFEQVKPKSVVTRVPAGDKQVLLVFTMPKSADPMKEYALPIGYKDGRTIRSTQTMFSFMSIHMNSTSTGALRCGKRWTHTRCLWG